MANRIGHEDEIANALGRAIIDAARMLIGMVRAAEQSERGRAQKTELELRVELTGGGTETWVLTIERTASSH